MQAVIRLLITERVVKWVIFFYNALGDTAGSLSNTGPFSNVQSNYYWSATEYAPDIGDAWNFGMGNNGYQSKLNKRYSLYAWAVQSGDIGVVSAVSLPGVSAVPLPAAVWLFASGLLALLGLARRKR